MRPADVGQKMVEDVGRAGQPRARLDATSGASIRRIGGAGVFEHRREEDRSGSQLPRALGREVARRIEGAPTLVDLGAHRCREREVWIEADIVAHSSEREICTIALDWEAHRTIDEGTTGGVSSSEACVGAVTSSEREIREHGGPTAGTAATTSLSPG